MITDEYAIDNIMRDVFRMSKEGRVELIQKLRISYCSKCGTDLKIIDDPRVGLSLRNHRCKNGK